MLIDLTNLDAVKRRVEVASAADDAEIRAAISGFSQHLLTRTGRASLNSVASLDELYDGNGNTRLFLRNYPVRTLTAVLVNTVALPISTSPANWGVFVEASGRSLGLRQGMGAGPSFPWPRLNLSPFRATKGPTFMYGQGNVEVIYTAGYEPTSVSDVLTITGGTVTLTQPTWTSDAGVLFFPSLAPLELVPNSPASGQYAVANGLYGFAAGDEGKQVVVNYQAALAPPDLEYAVRCVVAINYKRKAWQDQKSRGVNSQGAGSTTNYRDWEWPPEYDGVFESYMRKSFS